MLHHANCFDVLPDIPASSIDLVLTDLPYGYTEAAWDVGLSLPDLWPHLTRIIKPQRAIALFASQPFTSDLISSNRRWFKYVWYWMKTLPTGFLDARKKPLKKVEEVCVFGTPGRSVRYFPQMSKCKGRWQGGPKTSTTLYGHSKTGKEKYWSDERFPTNVLEFKKDRPNLHPTQKPIALCEYLVRTYTEPGDVVLDVCFGSGNSLVAAKNLERRYIGIELDATFFEIGRNRLE